MDQPSGMPADAPDAEIECVDCGGPARLMTRPDEDGHFWPGEIVMYRCRDCLDGWYIEIPYDDSIDRGE